MTTLTRGDVTLLLYAGMAVLALWCLAAVVDWLIGRLADRHTADDTSWVDAVGPDPFLGPDHATCEHNGGCDVVLCYCDGPALCPGTEEPRCGHHQFLCNAHACVDCTDCRHAAQAERDRLYDLENGQPS